MDDMFWLIVWACAVAVSYLMAENQKRDVRWAVVGGIMFGWLCPLYYLVTKKKEEQK